MLRAGATIALLVLLGRFSGFAREWLLSVRAGATEAADIAVVLLTLPDLLVNLLLGGALTAALVPSLRRLPLAQASAMMLQVLAVVIPVFVIIALVLTVFGTPVLSLLAPGLPANYLSKHMISVSLTAAAIPLTALSGVVVAALNARDRFTSGAVGTLIFNLAILMALGLSSDQNIALPVSLGVLAGAVLRVAIQMADLRRDFAHPSFQHWHVDFDFLGRFLGAFSFVTIIVLLAPVARAFASYGEPGGLALFNYAYKLVELPLGVGIGALVTVLLSKLSSSMATEEGARGNAVVVQLAFGIRCTIQFSLAVGIPAAFFSGGLVDVVFFGASFSPEQRMVLAQTAAVGFLSLPFQAVLPVYGAAFAASLSTRSLVAVALPMPLLLWLGAEYASERWGVVGVMSAYALTFVVAAVALTVLAVRRFGGSLLSGVFSKAITSFVLPIGVTTALALLGRQWADGRWQQLACMSLVFVLSVATIVLADEQTRRRLLRRIPGRDSQ